MRTESHADAALLAQIAELRARLEEAEETLQAIRTGAVDALVVETAAGLQVFLLQGLEAESNRFRGKMLAQVGDAVITIDDDQRVLPARVDAQLPQKAGKSHREPVARDDVRHRGPSPTAPDRPARGRACAPGLPGT